MRRSLPIDRTTTSPELRPILIWIETPCVRRSSDESSVIVSRMNG